MPNSFSNDPKHTGSYLRATEDISRVVKDLPLGATDLRIQFLLYYSFCEKLAASMIGVTAIPPITIDKAYKSSARLISGESVYEACGKLGLKFSRIDMNTVFDIGNEAQKTARYLRNAFMHRPGPTHLNAIRDQAPTLVPLMTSFLDGINALGRHLSK